ncbi:hypothetical protein E2P81_ATG07627 [Venturia nashicola]|uniref:MOZ protein represents a chromatin-associated acetyltransferase n=1 Tax=Venturia nashicola TaxID=86259 RepID=A0A4Z1P7H2_9PEZI|nr:hypothetical protein E6O75_ATG07785 [Venturia nashicola]TLD32137.1 hypothetical protein E2P81_ATG07627 [Venturia nashicola]
MAAPRLYFLYPSFFRATGAVETGPIRTSVRCRPARAVFSTCTRRSIDQRPQRSGPQKKPASPTVDRGRLGRAPASNRKAGPGEPGFIDEAIPLPTPAEDQPSPQEKPQKLEGIEGAPPPDLIPTGQDSSSSSSPPIEIPPPPELKSPQTNSTETVLSMPSPADDSQEDKPPHLQTPPYVHHFDTYSLVQGLSSGGFTADQSTTVMKAVRTILTENMDLARRGLVSKSNVENEQYLFKAASSELKTEVQNNRKVESERQRTQRAHLQHEVDILNQRVGQDTATLKDELKGMFDDRKMAVKMEQRNMDSKIQELNYKIAVALNSDARTEVEGVRWVLTRRAASALAVAVIMVLFTLNYSRYMTATQAKERKKHEEMMHSQEPFAKKEMSSTGTQTSGSEGAPVDALLASEGVNIDSR